MFECGCVCDGSVHIKIGDVDDNGVSYNGDGNDGNLTEIPWKRKQYVVQLHSQYTVKWSLCSFNEINLSVSVEDV